MVVSMGTCASLRRSFLPRVVGCCMGEGEVSGSRGMGAVSCATDLGRNTCGWRMTCLSYASVSCAPVLFLRCTSSYNHRCQDLMPLFLIILLSTLAWSKSELYLGAIGAWTAYAPDLLIAIIAAHLDFQKNWDASVAERFGPPIIQIPQVHPNATSINLRIGTTHARQDVGVASALDMMLGLDGAPPVIGLIGGSLSSVTMPIATMAAVQQVPQLSFSATSFALSNKDAYPFFLRTAPPDNIQSRALWRWILQFEVVLATCLYTTEGYGQGLYTVLKELAQADGYQDRVQGQGLQEPFDRDEARKVARIARRMGSRFIILLMSQVMAMSFIYVLEEEGMLSSEWQIVGSDTLSSIGIRHVLPVGFMFFLSDGKGEKFHDFRQLWSMLEPEDIIGPQSLGKYRLLGTHEVPTSSQLFRPL